MNLHILTAYTQDYENVGNLCYDSILRYGRKLGISHSNSIIPADYRRPPSWFKLEAIKEKLPHFDCVLWVDADAMIIGDRDVREIIGPDTVNLSKDINGPNCGVMALRNCAKAFEFLGKADSLYEQFKEYPWYEQAAIQSFIHNFDAKYHPKHIWNAYPSEVEGGGDVTKETLICHWPGVPFREKIAWMKFMEVRASALLHL
jgi:hypothetical protein